MSGGLCSGCSVGRVSFGARCPCCGMRLCYECESRHAEDDPKGYAEAERERGREEYERERWADEGRGRGWYGS